MRAENRLIKNKLIIFKNRFIKETLIIPVLYKTRIERIYKS